MKPLKEIQKSVRRAAVETRPEGDRAVRDDLLRELAARKTDAPRTWRMVTSGWARIAAVVTVTAILGLLALPRFLDETGARSPNGRAQTASDLLTVGSLNAACRRGGVSEIERQCDHAADKLNLQPETISAEELLEELKGT